MASKIDFRKTLKPIYNPSINGFHFIDVPRFSFLMVDGQGDPNTSPEYQESVEALYSMSYGIKFAYKSKGFDHVVPPLEGLWWMDDMTEFTLSNKSLWKWTMMIMQPEWVTDESMENVKIKVHNKIKSPVVSNIRLSSYHEGQAIQILYTGPYEDEAPVIAEMHRFITANGYLPSGKHHEIYLSDPRKVDPAKNKTILRQPIQNI